MPSVKLKIIGFYLIIIISALLSGIDKGILFANSANAEYGYLLTANSSSVYEAPLGKVAKPAVIADINGKGSEPEVIEIDLASYFGNRKGSAVFYNPNSRVYEVYNLNAANIQRSPCSTFKIASTLAALEYGIITPSKSLRKWSKEIFWHSNWNRDMSLNDAFKGSCVWYYRNIIDEIGKEKIQSFLDGLNYGNNNISDWEGVLNTNSDNRALTGFWIESSLKISPMEQVGMLDRIFGSQSAYQPKNVKSLMEIMKVDHTETPINIYGKTGYGKMEDVSWDSWFVGMFELSSGRKYFAVHLSESTDPKVTSALAKEIALGIIKNEYGK